MAYKWTNNAIATATSVASEDLILTVDDPSGTPVSKKITVANLIGSTDVISVIESNTNVTLAGSYDYLTISGQVITLGQIDLSTDVTGTLASGNIGSHTHVIADVTDFTDSSTNWNTAYGWGDHGTEGYLTSYTETDPIFVASDVYDVTTADIATWDTAYGWGNHGSVGYLTSYTETDPVFVASDVYGVTTADIGTWDTAYGWGDHSTEGYLTSYTESDPVFVASDVYGVTTADIGTWDTAYGWGDHSTENYAVTTGDTFTGDVLFNGGFTVNSSGNEALSITRSGSSDLTLSSSGSGDLVIAHSGSGTLLIGGIDFETQAPLWNTAYGWGDHSTEGYLTSYTETDPIFVASDVYGVTTADIASWDTAYGWGDHSTQGYITEAGGSGTVTSIATAGTVSGLTLTGGTITTSGTITLGGTISITESQISDIGSHTHTSSSITDFDSAVSGVIEDFTGTAKFTQNSISANAIEVEATESSSSAGPIVWLKRNSASPSDGDYIGQFKFVGENDANQEVNYAKITGKIKDVTDGTEDGLIEFMVKSDGSNKIAARITNNDLTLLNGTGIDSDGDVNTDGSIKTSGTTRITDAGVLQNVSMDASDITSGTLSHERGGLEADVSAYDGFVKISGGASSAVTDNSSNWNTAYGWGDHSTAGYSTSTGTVTSVATSGSVDGLTLTGGTITGSGTITLGGSISITESQISDLQSYITGITGEPLSDLSDATITAVASGEILKWSGSAWINNTLAEADIASAATLSSHAGSTANPHSVTATQVGLGNVENTALSTWSGSSNVTTVGETAVTAHEGALTITESQVSDLGNYVDAGTALVYSIIF